MSLVGKAELQRYDVPDKPGPGGWADQYMMARPIGWVDLDRARVTRTRTVMQSMNEMGRDQLDRIDSVKRDDSLRDPYLEYDKGVVLNACTIQWSYSDTPTPDEIGELPPVVAQAYYEWLIDTFVLGEAEGKGYTPSSNGARSTAAAPAGLAT